MTFFKVTSISSSTKLHLPSLTPISWWVPQQRRKEGIKLIMTTLCFRSLMRWNMRMKTVLSKIRRTTSRARRIMYPNPHRYQTLKRRLISGLKGKRRAHSILNTIAILTLSLLLRTQTMERPWTCQCFGLITTQRCTDEMKWSKAQRPHAILP